MPHPAFVLCECGDRIPIPTKRILTPPASEHSAPRDAPQCA